VKKQKTLLLILFVIGSLLLVACQPETVEVTRVVTETVEV
jgi:hypothetical protein